MSPNSSAAMPPQSRQTILRINKRSVPWVPDLVHVRVPKRQRLSSTLRGLNLNNAASATSEARDHDDLARWKVFRRVIFDASQARDGMELADSEEMPKARTALDALTSRPDVRIIDLNARDLRPQVASEEVAAMQPEQPAEQPAPHALATEVKPVPVAMDQVTLNGETMVPVKDQLASMVDEASNETIINDMVFFAHDDMDLSKVPQLQRKQTHGDDQIADDDHIAAFIDNPLILDQALSDDAEEVIGPASSDEDARSVDYPATPPESTDSEGDYEYTHMESRRKDFRTALFDDDNYDEDADPDYIYPETHGYGGQDEQ